jgi:hypothetical protein
MSLRSPGLNKRGLRTSDFDITRVIFEDPSTKVVVPKKEEVMTPAWRVIHDFPNGSPNEKSNNPQPSGRGRIQSRTLPTSPPPTLQLSQPTPSPSITTDTSSIKTEQQQPQPQQPAANGVPTESGEQLNSLLVQPNTNTSTTNQASNTDGPGGTFRAVSPPPSVPLGILPSETPTTNDNTATKGSCFSFVVFFSF